MMTMTKTRMITMTNTTITRHTNTATNQRTPIKIIYATKTPQAKIKSS